MALPLILGLAGSFFGGAYLGTVINNATASPDIVINAGDNMENKLDNKDLILAGCLGITGWYVYKRFLK